MFAFLIFSIPASENSVICWTICSISFLFFGGAARGCFISGLGCMNISICPLTLAALDARLHVLCESYRRLRMREGLPSSRLRAAGYLAPENKAYLTGIQKSLDSWGLSHHFHYHGELDKQGKLDFLRNLSVFSVPGPYDDPKGLFLLEAMASGVPVIQPRRGAFSEIVETAGGGLLVEPDNPDALADAMLALWRDPERRMELGSRGYEGVQKHYSATRMSAKVLEIYQSLLNTKRGDSH